MLSLLIAPLLSTSLVLHTPTNDAGRLYASTSRTRVHHTRMWRTRKGTTTPISISPTPVPTPVSQPDTSPSTPAPALAPALATSSFALQVEKYVHDRVNAERTKAGLSQLSWSDQLSVIARSHSKDMAVNNYFAHDNLAGCSASCRMTNAGYAWKSMGENIAWLKGYNLGADATAEKIVTGWMNSPGHRANILNGTFTTEGIGIYEQGDLIEATQDLSLPR